MMRHFEHKKTRFKRKKLGKKEANYAIKNAHIVARLENIFYLCIRTIALFGQNPLPDFSGGGDFEV